MRITSLNLRGFFDWDSREQPIADYLTDTASDVVLFQEVVYLPQLAPVPQVDLLNRRLGLAHRHASVTRLQPSPQFGPYREGLALLTDLQVAGSESLVLHHEEHDPHNRIVQFADVEFEGSVWLLANVHLSVRDDYALHHLQEVLGMLRARGEERIIGGDFNVNHLERHRSLWKDRYVLSTEVEQYVSYEGSDQANDYFLVPKTYEIASIALSPDGLSDHRALTVEIAPVA